MGPRRTGFDDGAKALVSTLLFGPEARGEPKSVVVALEVQRREVDADSRRHAGQGRRPVNRRQIVAHQAERRPVVDLSNGEMVEVEVDARRGADVDQIDDLGAPARDGADDRLKDG